jgi:hypothetical protein
LFLRLFLINFNPNKIPMKKTLQTLALSFLLGGVITAQAQQKLQPCNTYDAMEQAFSEDPSARTRYEAEQEKLRKAVEDYENSLQLNKTTATEYTVPVVFHVMHMNGPENVSDATLISALAQVNKDFAKQNADSATVNATYKPLHTDADIKFMLAHKDPLGNCTNGIVHHYHTGTDWNQSSPSYAYTGTAAGLWNPTKYLNIYIVRQICATTSTCSTSGGMIVGYTYKPGTWSTGFSRDAIVYHYQFLSGMDVRSLSHEIGHWLNLSHTFGNTNNPGVTCGDDGITDTPPTKGYFSTCPGSNAGPFTGCSTSENIENIMDYSSCPKMFTQGQVNVMRTALASSISGRNNLITTTNLTTNTDVDGTTICAPKADLYAQSGSAANVYTVCSGQSLTFVDASYNATVTARNWSATGGAAVANPTASSTGITFPTVGTQTVTLMVSNSTGSATATKTVLVLNGTPNYTTTYSESFETLGLPSNWSIPSTGSTWQQYLGFGASGSACYWIDGSQETAGSVNILQTGSYDFLNNPGAIFTFKYAYAKYSSTNADVFKVQASSNCGSTWTDINMPNNTTLASGSGGITSAPFTPSSTAQFKTYTLTSHPAFNPFKIQSNVQLRFVFTENPTAGAQNNFYIDDINFSMPLGLNELSQSIAFGIYPNPTTGAATISFRLSEHSKINYSVCDVIGRVVESEKTLSLDPGPHHFNVNENGNLKTGIYFVNFDINGQRISQKLIVE